MHLKFGEFSVKGLKVIAVQTENNDRPVKKQ